MDFISNYALHIDNRNKEAIFWSDKKSLDILYDVFGSVIMQITRNLSVIAFNLYVEHLITTAGLDNNFEKNKKKTENKRARWLRAILVQLIKKCNQILINRLKIYRKCKKCTLVATILFT